MFFGEPADILQYLAKTGPLSLEELTVRTSSDLDEVVQKVKQLHDSGDVEIVGADTDTAEQTLSAFLRSENQIARSGSQERQDFFRALRANDAHNLKVQLSSRGFKKARVYGR